MAKFFFSRRAFLSGMVIRSTVDSGIIDQIRYPNLGNQFITVEAKDIRGDNRVKIGSSSMPLLSSSQISYKGQPVLALFGLDRESVILRARDVDISYRLAENITPVTPPGPFHREDGNWEEATSQEGLKTCECTYRVGRVHSATYPVMRITAGMEGDTLHIIGPTQWQAHMKDTVSEITRVPKSRIVIHREPFYASHDEMVLRPSFLAAIAALASLKSGYPVEILDSEPVWRPQYTITRKTWYTGEGRPVAEQVDATVDQGAFPLFSEEIARQMYAGFAPVCDLQAYRYTVTIAVSEAVPACFYGNLGYANALATTAAQYNGIARSVGLRPDEWISKNASSGGFHEKFVNASEYAEMKAAVVELASKSSFPRKYADWETMNKKNKSGVIPTRFSNQVGFLRGVSLVAGPGICGFSGEETSVLPMSVQIQLDANDKVEINTSFSAGGVGNISSLWKSIVSSKLGVEKEDISFAADGVGLIDSGPSVLDAQSGKMAQLITRACDTIREKRFVNPLPIIQRVTEERSKSYLFDSTGWILVVCEVKIDTVTFVPWVQKVWVTAIVGKVSNETTYREKIRHTVVSALRTAGAQLAGDSPLVIDITLRQESDGIANSVSSAVDALVTSAFGQALSQAMGSDYGPLPVDPEQIMNTLIQRKKI